MQWRSPGDSPFATQRLPPATLPYPQPIWPKKQKSAQTDATGKIAECRFLVSFHQLLSQCFRRVHCWLEPDEPHCHVPGASSGASLARRGAVLTTQARGVFRRQGRCISSVPARTISTALRMRMWGDYRLGDYGGEEGCKLC